MEMVPSRRSSVPCEFLPPACDPCVETAACVGLTGPAICLLSMRENSALWSAWGAAIIPLTVSPSIVEDTNISLIPELEDFFPPFQFLLNIISYSKLQFLGHVIPDIFVPKHNKDKIGVVLYSQVYTFFRNGVYYRVGGRKLPIFPVLP